jgi:hypothetical protein
VGIYDSYYALNWLSDIKEKTEEKWPKGGGTFEGYFGEQNRLGLHLFRGGFRYGAEMYGQGWGLEDTALKGIFGGGIPLDYLRVNGEGRDKTLFYFHSKYAYLINYMRECEQFCYQDFEIEKNRSSMSLAKLDFYLGKEKAIYGPFSIEGIAGVANTLWYSSYPGYTTSFSKSLRRDFGTLNNFLLSLRLNASYPKIKMGLGGEGSFVVGESPFTFYGGTWEKVSNLIPHSQRMGMIGVFTSPDFNLWVRSGILNDLGYYLQAGSKTGPVFFGYQGDIVDKEKEQILPSSHKVSLGFRLFEFNLSIGYYLTSRNNSSFLVSLSSF